MSGILREGFGVGREKDTHMGRPCFIIPICVILLIWEFTRGLSRSMGLLVS